jgi:hypothetical protein
MTHLRKMKLILSHMVAVLGAQISRSLFLL